MRRDEGWIDCEWVGCKWAVLAVFSKMVGYLCNRHPPQGHQGLLLGCEVLRGQVEHGCVLESNPARPGPAAFDAL